MKQILLIMGAGALGTLARFSLYRFVPQMFGGGFAFSTVLINVLGCFLIGILSGQSQNEWVQSWWLILAVGFCGAFTTFSTFILETVDFIRGEQMLKAFLNMSLSLILGFAFLYLGLFLSQRFA